MTNFEELELNDDLYNAICELGFDTPTQIQQRSIPPILEGKDVVGESATGSGKTLAFACGIVENTIPKQGIQALVITPTRELAEQIKGSIRDLSKADPLGVIAVYGGTHMNKQIKALKKADVVVATPGRLLDHIRRDSIDLSKVGVLVIDEADRMFDMGFIDDVEKIIKECKGKHQTLLFSATINTRVNKLAERHMKDPVKVYAEKMVKPEKLEQVYYEVTKTMKLSLLVHLLSQETSELTMVFCNTRRTVDFVAKNLRAYKINAIPIHGGLSQKVRTRMMGYFNDAEVDVLVCTDVAARGLHIDNVSHIYNFELPIVPNDYVHRIGRTARAGEEGKVINLISSKDKPAFSKIRGKFPKFKIEQIERPKITQLEVIGRDTSSDRMNPLETANKREEIFEKHKFKRTHPKIEKKNRPGITNRDNRSYRRSGPGRDRYRSKEGTEKKGSSPDQGGNKPYSGKKGDKNAYKPRSKPGSKKKHQNKSQRNQDRKPYSGQGSREGARPSHKPYGKYSHENKKFAAKKRRYGKKRK